MLKMRSQQRKGGKLVPNYLGPYNIAVITGKTVGVVNSQGVTTPKVNIDHLIVFTEEQPQQQSSTQVFHYWIAF